MRALSFVSVEEIMNNPARKHWPVGDVKKAEIWSSHPSDLFVLWNSGGLSDALRRSAYNAWDDVEGVFGELAYEIRQEAI